MPREIAEFACASYLRHLSRFTIRRRTLACWVVLAGAALVGQPAAGIAADADRFEPLFDGKSLDGWTALPGGTWKVVDGMLVGTQENTEKLHGILVSKKSYGDFVLRCTFKALEGNSGIYFRCAKVDHEVAVKGFQAEIDSAGADVGGLYETLGRAWVVQPDKELVASIYKPREWNEMAIAAVGGNVTVTVNGVKTAELKDDPGARSGHIGLQLHGGQKMNVYYKKIEIWEVTDPAQPVILQKIHDTSIPLPPIVEPRALAELESASRPPADAIVLFDGSSLDHWQGGPWAVRDGCMETDQGDLMTRRGFSDCRLHLEWRIADPDSHGNSGVYLMNQYEVQIFNSHNNHSPIYADGMAGAIYGQAPPLANACRPAGEWELFDIDFTAPRFDPSGRLESPARMTVLHNGILVQDNVALTGPTGHQERPPYRKQADEMPFYLQNHGDRLQFRNIWIVER